MNIGSVVLKKILFLLLILLFFAVNSYALRIVSLSPSVTEIIFKLGAGKDVAGDTLFSNYPKQAARLPKVGSYIHPSLEEILRLHPNYVLGMREGTDERIKAKLDELGIKSRFYRARNVEDIIFTIQDIAKLLGKNPKPVIKRIRHFYSSYAKSGKTGIFLVSIEPLMASTQNTFINDIMKCAGINNIVKDNALEYITIDKEFIVEKQPDFIIVSLGIKRQIEAAKRLIERFHLKSKLLIVNPNIYNRPSYRIVNACLDLRKKVSR